MQNPTPPSKLAVSIENMKEKGCIIKGELESTGIEGGVLKIIRHSAEQFGPELTAEGLNQSPKLEI